MAATRPSTRIQRRAQPMAACNRHLGVVHQLSQMLVSTQQEAPIPVTAPTTAGPAPLLDNKLVPRIASEVTQPVVASFHQQQQSTARNGLPEIESETREVTLGGISVADSTVQGPVASAMANLTGEDQVQLGASHSHLSGDGMSNFNSISTTIDAQVSPKLEAKIWANEFIDFGLLLNPHLGDTCYQLSLSTTESSVPTLSLEPNHQDKTHSQC